MLKKLLKAQLKLESNWFTLFVLLMPLFGFAVVPLICLYTLLLPNYLLRSETEASAAMAMYLQLPMKRNDVVKGRLLYVALWQIAVCASFLLGALFGFVLNAFVTDIDLNSVYSGWVLDQNLTLLGILLLGMGFHNAITDLFSSYYKRFAASISAIALCWVLNTLAVKFASTYLYGYGLTFMWVRAIVFVVGAGAFCGLTYVGYKKHLKKFAAKL